MPHRELARQTVSDAQVMTSAGSSLTAWVITWTEYLTPLVDFMAGMVAIVAGIMAIAWTGMKMYDRYKEMKSR
jgi:hypothetical protein